MLTQTKRVVDGLKAAGLARKDFKVQTKTDKNGEYSQDPMIVIELSTEELTPLVPALVENGFTVRHYIFNSDMEHYSISHTPYGKSAAIITEDYRK